MSLLLTNLMHRSVAAVAVTLCMCNTVIAETHIVEIRNFKFTPSKLTVQAGDIVIWKNLDIVPHTATDRKKSWDTGLIAAGETVELQFDEFAAGEYFCAYHPDMIATLEKSE